MQKSNITWKDRENKMDFSWDTWNQRISLMYRILDEEISSVIDLGAGAMYLKNLLPPNVIYYPVDYVLRCNDTIVCDFNSYEFPNLEADMCFISGCLEYINDVQWFFDKISNTGCRTVILSYCIFEKRNDSEKEENGWVNDLTFNEVLQLAHDRGFVLTEWDKYYEHSPILKFEKNKVKLIEKNYFCTGCGACKELCEYEAINMEIDDTGFYKPKIDENKCTNCQVCLKNCPILHPDYINNSEPICYSACAADNIRDRSSSGGVFSVLAKVVLDNNGVVFGAVWTDEFYVRHIGISSEQNLSFLSKSKYLQSDVGTSYSEARGKLEEGVQVLFSGCPCQIAGLNKYLGRSYDNLITIDLLCHYVPSAKVFNKYIDENFGLQNIKSFTFRDKTNGWNYDSQKIIMNDDTIIMRNEKNDYFQKGFHARLFMNETCENCRFARLPRQGDITLGDFWTDSYNTESAFFKDRKGISEVLINNEKGKNYFNKISTCLNMLEKVDINTVLQNRITQQYNRHPQQNYFNQLIKNHKFNDAVEKALNNKRDIVIVGDWGVENYGANLTYYALYKVIIEMGLNPLMVERTLDAPWKPKETPTLFSKLPYDECHILKYRNNRIELKELNNYSSTFLVGSDQLFNSGLYHAFGKFINLDWVKSNKRKIVYGASFGSNSQLYTESDRAELQFYLKQFDFVSVREYHAKQFMNENLTVNCEWVLDPVFLCNSSIYSELAIKSKIQRPFKYVGAYVLEPTDEKIEAIERISDELNCEHYISTDALYEQKEIDKKSWGNRIRKGLFVEDFVAQIYHSEFFITDSFHGTCLAILLHKPFVTILNDTRGSDRFYSLLKLLKLEDRLFKNIKEFNNCDDILSRQIDYDKVDIILNSEKEKSKKWLINSIFSSISPKSISQYDILDDRLDERMHEEYKYRLLVENHFKEVEKTCCQMDLEEQEYRKLVEKHFYRIESDCTSMAEDEKEYRYRVENHLRDIEAKIDYLNEKFLLTKEELGNREIELNKILSSKTYNLGKFMLFIPKKIKNLFNKFKRK